MRTCFAAFVMAGALLGADPTVEGPRLGYVSSGDGVRSVLGIVGASYLGEPIAGNWQRSVVPPGKNIAVAVTADGKLVKVNLLSGEEADLKLAGVAGLAASPSGDAVLAVTTDRAYWFSTSGTRLADVALPAAPVRMAVADVGTAAAIIAAEPEGEVLWVLNANGARRLIAAEALPAVAFVAQSSDLLVASKAGIVSRVFNDGQVAQLTAIPDVTALAGIPSAAIVVAKGGMYAVNLSTSETVRVECQCSPSSATPIAQNTFLLTAGRVGPMWILDTASDFLRTAFIPEAGR